MSAAHGRMDETQALRVLEGPCVRCLSLELVRELSEEPRRQTWELASEHDLHRGDKLAAAPVDRTGLRAWAQRTRAAETRKRRGRHRPWKPWPSGTWWSGSQEYRRWTTGRVPEGFDLVEDSVGPEVQFAAAVAAPVDVLEIRSALNWARLCHEHPL